MRWRGWIRQLTGILRRRRFEHELDEDVRMHLEMAAEEYVRRGLGPEEARAAARRSFGPIAQMKEVCRETGGISFVEGVGQDLRFCVRLLLKERIFTLAAITVLAVGIGLNATMFSVVNAVLVQPLPYIDPDRIVRVFETFPPAGGRFPLSPLNFLDWRAGNRVFEQMAVYGMERLALTTAEGPEPITGMRVSADFFPLLGITAEQGRLFAPEEDEPDADRVAVLGHDAWLNRFGGDPDIIGRNVPLANGSVDVIGVLPADFYLSGASEVEIWKPMRLAADSRRTSRTERYLNTIARLSDDVSVAEAQAEMDAVAAGLASEFPEGIEANGVAVVSLHDALVGNELRSSVLVLWAAVGVVLLVACFNFANLLLARSIARQGEFAVRSSLGAGWLRVLRQHITETTFLALTGVGVGLLLASWSGATVSSLLNTASFPFAARRLQQVGIDGTVVGFSILIALAASLAGLLPAFRYTTGRVADRLRDNGRNLTVGLGQLRIRDALVVAQFSLTLMLLVATGLLINSFWHVLGVDMGFDRHRLLTLQLQATPEEAGVFYPSLVDAVSGVPGVEAAGVVNQLPLMGPDFAANVVFENPQVDSLGPARSVDHRIVDGNYFEAIGTELLEGRYFDDRDAIGSQPVTILNETLARRYWPTGSPIGQRLVRDGNRTGETIVGVVEDMKVFGPDSDPRPEIYFPHSQFGLLPDSPLRLPNMFAVVRTSGDPSTLTSAVRGRIRQLDRTRLITTVRTMEQVLSESVAPRRLNLALLTTFGLAGLLLATAGTYGVVAYSATQRTHEVGIRVALGAKPFHVFGLVMRHGLRLAALGLALGLVGTFIVTRWMSTMLFGVSPMDPATIISISLLLMVVTLLASCLPARRASRMDPMIALRQE